MAYGNSGVNLAADQKTLTLLLRIWQQTAPLLKPITSPMNSHQNHREPNTRPSTPQGISRRSFIKKSALSAGAIAILSQGLALEQNTSASTSSWLLVCTSAPIQQNDTVTDSGITGKLEITLSDLKGPAKGDVGSGRIMTGATADKEHTITGWQAIANLELMIQTVSMDTSGEGRPTIVFSPPRVDQKTGGTKPPPNISTRQDDLQLRVVIESGRVCGVATWAGNAATTTISLPQGTGDVELNLDGSFKCEILRNWTFSVMTSAEYAEWKRINL